MSINKRYVSMNIIPSLLKSEERFKRYYQSDALIFQDRESEKYFDFYRHGYSLDLLNHYYDRQNNRKFIS